MSLSWLYEIPPLRTLQARMKDLDQIQMIDLDPVVRHRRKLSTVEYMTPLRLQNRAALETQPLDFEKPGLAQHYCVECAKCGLLREST